MTKKVFISYSHDSDEHKDWVYRLSCELVKNGIDVVLDQWDLMLGSNLPRFMHEGLSESERVIVVCTDNYVKKSDAGTGGAGYEGAILTAELFRDQDSSKYIPLIRGVAGSRKVPRCLDGRLYIDFTSNDSYESMFKQLLHEIYGVPLRPKPAMGVNPFRPEVELPRMGDNDTVYFSGRFEQSFPGTRGIVWFNDSQEATNRLCHFLRPPLQFEDGTPFWWWRNGNLHIEKFEKTGPSSVLMNFDELNIEKMAVVNDGAYYQQFIYVLCRPSEPSGVSQLNIEAQVKYKGYASEEFAIFDGRFITVAEADDGATVIDGMPVSTNGKSESRCRFLTPYNFVIAPNGSPINNQDFDESLVIMLNGMLSDKVAVEELVQAVRRLPKSRY